MTATIGLQVYLEHNTDNMMQLVYRRHQKRKLYSIVKESVKSGLKEGNG